MAVEKEYKRLSGARHWFRISSLFQGREHLLLVQNSGFSEEYKRFYFRDIQAFLLRPSPRLLGWSVVWALFCLGSLWLAYEVYGWNYTPGSWSRLLSPAFLLGAWSFWFGPVFFLVCLAINLGLGPSCVCHVKTAIQTVEVPITRFRKARKVMERLQPLIEQAQQNLSSAPGFPVTPPSGPVTQDAGVSPAPPTLKPFRAGAHRAFFILIAVASFLEITRFFHLSVTLFLAEAALKSLAALVSVAALMEQSQTDTPGTLRRITWGAFILLAAVYGIGFWEGLEIGHFSKSWDQWVWVKWLASQPPDRTTARLFLSGTLILGGLFFGLLGMVELSFYQKRKRQG